MTARSVVVEIQGVELVSEANRASHEFWRARQRRVSTQRSVVGAVLRLHRPPPVPAVVTITRIAPRPLDSDNLAGSAKAVRDTVASWLGIDDRDERVTWRVVHESRGVREYAVRIAVEPWTGVGIGARVLDDGPRQRVEIVIGPAAMRATAAMLADVLEGGRDRAVLRVGRVDVEFRRTATESPETARESTGAPDDSSRAGVGPRHGCHGSIDSVGARPSTNRHLPRARPGEQR